MLDIPKQLNIKGAILAGGRATRMSGIVKGMLLDKTGQSIIENLLNEMRLAGISDIIIAANDPSPYMGFNVEIVPDQRKDVGPIAGIESSLLYFRDQCDGVLFMPCDMPNITAREMITLKEAFSHSKIGIVQAETSSFFCHPLCAVVHNEMTSQIVGAIDYGQKKVQELWHQLEAERVKFSDLAAFMNMNTLSDVNHWRESKNEKKNLC